MKFILVKDETKEVMKHVFSNDGQLKEYMKKNRCNPLDYRIRRASWKNRMRLF